MLARALGIRIKTCFEDDGQLISATDDDDAVIRLDLQTMTVKVDHSSAEAKINQFKSAFISRYSAFVSEQEVPYHDDPEPF